MLRISHLSIKDQIPMSRIVSKYENRLNLFVRGSVVVGEGGLHNCPVRGGLHRSKQFKDQVNGIVAHRAINTFQTFHCPRKIFIS